MTPTEPVAEFVGYLRGQNLAVELAARLATHAIAGNLLGKRKILIEFFSEQQPIAEESIAFCCLLGCIQERFPLAYDFHLTFHARFLLIRYIFLNTLKISHFFQLDGIGWIGAKL